MALKGKTAIYSGTFDPITNGHLDIIKRAREVFDNVIIAVAHSDTKNTMFNVEQRVKMVDFAIKDIDNTKAIAFNTLLVDFAKKHNVYHIIRGLRAVSDFEFELQMSYTNNSLDKNIDTIYFMPTLQNAFVSSTSVREIIRFKGNYKHLVPQAVYEYLKTKTNKD